MEDRSLANDRAPAHSSVRYIGLIRHSARLDDVPADNDDEQSSRWTDRVERPYDPPIVDFDLPRRAAKQLEGYNFSRVISSPFRRCLQTAAVVANELGVETVDVHLGIGEAMAQVRRCGRSRAEAKEEERDFSYLKREDMSATLRNAIICPNAPVSGSSSMIPALGKIFGEKPTFEENDAERIQRALREIVAMEGSEESMLLVTHGDVLGQWVDVAAGETVIECDYCSWTVFSDYIPKRIKAALDNFTKVDDHGLASFVLEN